MNEQSKPNSSVAPCHGERHLPCVAVHSYNLELRDGAGFIGDRANKGAFRAILDEWRDKLADISGDPLGSASTHEVRQANLDDLLDKGEFEAAGLIHEAVNEFSEHLAGVIRRFLDLDEWRAVERIVVGGGLRQSHIGELAIGHAAVLLKGDGLRIEIRPIRHHPDDGGLIGCVHLMQPASLSGYDGVLAADIGGTNIRCGIVRLNQDEAEDFSAAEVVARDRWRHAEEKPERDEAVDRLACMLDALGKRAREDGLKLAPFVGVGCPGAIQEDGSIERGAQNLPGDWETRRFNLPRSLEEKIPRIEGRQTVVCLHNDAVVQGLSEVPFMRDVAEWGVLTIGTGLGNASFTNRM